MLNFLLRKLFHGVAMLVVVSALTFGLLSAAGGDALTALQENPQVSPRTIEHLRSVYGLDRPVQERYLAWLSGAVRGDLGNSLHFQVPVSGLIWSRFLNSLLLAGVAILFAIIPALAISMLRARSRSRALGRLIDALVLLLSSTPRIVLALAVLAISVSVAGIPSLTGGGLAAIIPAALVLSAPLFAIFLAQANEGLAEAMQQDFTQLARAKGLGEDYVVLRHALPAALNPLITLLGLAIGGLLGGSVIVETVLGWPGIGSLTVFAVRSRDITLLLGIVVLTSIAVWFGNALAEFLHGVVDKRVRDVRDR